MKGRNVTTERDMLDALASRYSAIRKGTTADRWVTAEHVRLRLGHAPRQRIADFVAIDKYPGFPYGSSIALHGHEVKVSRSDFLRELSDMEKSEAFRPYMHHWWLAVSDASIVKDDLPAGWSLMVLRKDGLRAVHVVPRQEPQPLPLDLAVSLMSATARTAHRAPLHRDAPSVPVGSWDNLRCAWCGDPAPCQHHQGHHS